MTGLTRPGWSWWDDPCLGLNFHAVRASSHLLVKLRVGTHRGGGGGGGGEKRR